jgi:hypothetical protein
LIRLNNRSTSPLPIQRPKRHYGAVKFEGYWLSTRYSQGTIFGLKICFPF